MSTFQPPKSDDQPTIQVDHNAIWRKFTEDLIFAAAFADDPRTTTITWMRCLDSRRIKYNPDDEGRKCRALCEAITREFKHINGPITFDEEGKLIDSTRLSRANAANDHKTFRLRHADLLPRHP